MTPRQRVVKYLIQITRNKTVEQQLRQQWLTELKEIQNETTRRTSTSPKHKRHMGM